ncbi:MAG: ATP-binding cassette domain-containing protein [Alphaproteobacteria bacterium]|nr:ATP-binding cassette domain-containing protein [Alphaproteobacteria bacterium]
MVAHKNYAPVVVSHFEADGSPKQNPLQCMRRLFANRWFDTGGEDGSRKEWLEALALALTALGWRGDEMRLSDVLPRQSDQEELDEFLNALASLGYIAHQVQSRDSAVWRNADLPLLMLARSDSGEELQPYVVTGWGEGANAWQIAAIDDEGGLGRKEISIDDERIAQVFSIGRTDTLHDSSEEFARQQTGVSWMRLTLQRFRGMFVQMIVVSLVIGLLTTAVPLFVMMVYDLVIDSHSLPSLTNATNLLLKLLLGVALAMGLECALRLSVIRSLSWFGARMQVLVGTALISQFFSLSPAVTERASAADQLSRIRAFDTMRDFISGPQMLAMLELPWCLVLLVVIGILSGPVVLIPMGGIALYALLAFAIRKPLEYEMYRSARSGSERQQTAMDMLTRLPAMRYSGVVEALFNRYTSSVRRAMQTTFRINMMVALLEHSAHAITALVGLLTLVVGLYAIWDGTLTVGSLVAVMILTWRLLGIIQANCVLQPRLHYLKNSTDQINRLMTLNSEDADFQHEVPVSGLKGHVECNGAVLRYTRSGEFVLRNVTLDIQPGQLVAVMGQSGSGKSSLLKLLCGLYPPQAGSLRIDGINIRQYVPHDLRQHMAYMPQSPDFFSGTIADNLRLVAPASTDADLRLAIENAGAMDEIAAMPEGLATEIGVGQNHLPLSLSHRLNLARIYLQDPSMMLLDEMPYDVLNSETGENFYDMLKTVKGKHTAIFVTHRMDFAELADQVVWLRHDMPPVVGTPKQVLAAMQKE